jgi:predicted nucleic acid-binding protein
LIYLDSVAVVKLLHTEPHSQALRSYLDEHSDTDWASSTLLEIEAFRALARTVAIAEMPAIINRFHALMDTITRLDIDPGVRIMAQTVGPPTVRSLDAIHLATALRLREQRRLTTFITYDKRLADAAAGAGLPTMMPEAAPD